MTEGQRLGRSVQLESQATAARDLIIPSWILERRDLDLEDKLFLALCEAGNPDRVERRARTPDLTVKAWILEIPELTTSEKLLLALMENLSRRSGLAFPADGTAAARLGLHPKTVKRLVRRLKKRRLLKPEIVGGGENHLAAYRVVYRSPGREQPVPVLEPAVPTGREQPVPPRLVQHVFLYETDQIKNKEKNQQKNREREATPPPVPAPAQSEDLEATVLSLLFPRGPSEKQQRAIAGPVAVLRAAGATGEFLALYLGRDLEGQPWARLDRALAAWCAERSYRAKAQAETEARRRTAEVMEAAAAAETQAIDPPLDPLARAVFAAVGPRAWGVWFSGVVLKQAGDVLLVQVSNLFLLDYIRLHFSDALRVAAAGGDVRIEVAQIAVAAEARP